MFRVREVFGIKFFLGRLVTIKKKMYCQFLDKYLYLKIIFLFIMKFFKYWIVDNEEKIDKHYILSKGVYVFFIFYFFLIGLIGLIRDKTIIAFIVAIFLPIIMIIVILGDILFFYNRVNKFSSKTHDLFQKIILSIRKQIIEGRKKALPMKVIFGRLIYMIVFFVIPFAFMFLVINGQWQYSTIAVSSGGSFGADEGFHKEMDQGNVNIKLTLEKDYRIKLSYLLGDILNIPVLDVCFVNNGTTYQEDTLNGTFLSKVKINNLLYDVPLVGKNCFEVNIDETSMDYEWITEYKYSLKGRLSNEGMKDLSTQAKNFVKVTINHNFWYMTFLVVIAWFAICHLIYHVFKDLNEIK